MALAPEQKLTYKEAGPAGVAASRRASRAGGARVPRLRVRSACPAHRPPAAHRPASCSSQDLHSEPFEVSDDQVCSPPAAPFSLRPFAHRRACLPPRQDSVQMRRGVLTRSRANSAHAPHLAAAQAHAVVADRRVLHHAAAPGRAPQQRQVHLRHAAVRRGERPPRARHGWTRSSASGAGEIIAAKGAAADTDAGRSRLAGRRQLSSPGGSPCSVGGLLGRPDPLHRRRQDLHRGALVGGADRSPTISSAGAFPGRIRPGNNEGVFDIARVNCRLVVARLQCAAARFRSHALLPRSAFVRARRSRAPHAQRDPHRVGPRDRRDLCDLASNPICDCC